MVKRLVRDLAEKVLDLELEGYLGAGWNHRTEGRSDYRNGHYRRWLTTPHGPVRLKVPRCRSGGFDSSTVFDHHQRRIADVDRILRYAYLLGCSSPATGQLVEQVFGGSVSHQTVSKLMRWIDEQLAAWRNQPIAPVYKVVHIDGMHVDVLGGDRMVMLVSGARDDGGLDVLGFSVGSGERCVELLADLRARSLDEVELFVRDESGAICDALEQVYPEVAWQHCTFHRLAALRKNVGRTDFRNLMVAEAGCIFRCPSKRAAVDTAIDWAWARQWKSLSPWAVKEFMDGLTDSLSFYSLPSDWWRSSRTNNPQERLIETLRMHLRPMGCFHDHPAIERAVFGQLLRWHKIKLTHNPRHYQGSLLS
ncbi:MAG: IS256 family transposase [Planctomycetes bacterium]|nr:IS256 family transposase [Planctomycetota bacterium]